MEGMSDASLRLGLDPIEPKPGTKLGIALGTLGRKPINALRHSPTHETNGWYIWCGPDFSDDDDFFSPLHLEHVSEYLPQILDYLTLPPGYRFIIDSEGFEDIWFDSTLLNE